MGSDLRSALMVPAIDLDAPPSAAIRLGDVGGMLRPDGRRQAYEVVPAGVLPVGA